MGAKKKNVLIEIINVTLSEECVGPPHLPLESTFKNLQEWLVNICDSEKPQKPIANYSFGLFQSQDIYVLYLVGKNTFNNSTTIDFRPTNMYFQLPKDEYPNLNRKQVTKKVTAQIIDFTKTSKFKTSFLANAISVDVGGRTIVK